jgi:hypothetical protein
MKRTPTIRRALAPLTLALVATATISEPAHAATAFLVHCEGGTSVTGRFIYVGTYNYAGNTFQRAFTSWCPNSVEVY